MATDQEIRDAGFKYIPQQKYLLNPFTLPTTDDDDDGDNTPSANVGGNPEGFSVYNPDPNRTRNIDQYRPFNYRQAAERSYIGAPGDYSYSSGTEAQKMMDNYPDYYEGKQLEGIPGAIANYAKNSLAGQLLGKAASGLESLLPVNRTAILQNELLGSGFRLNDIGQIVSDGGDYDTAGNVMSGYNTSRMTEKTFDDRIASLGNMTPEGKAKRTAAILEAKQNFIDAKNKTTTVFDDKSLEKNPDYVSFDDQLNINNMINTEKEEDEIINPNTLRYITKKKAAAAENTGADTTGTGTDIIVPPYVPDGTPGGGAGQGIDISGAGTIRSKDNDFQGDSGPTTQQEADSGYGSDAGWFADGGRVYFFDGGRVGVINGGLASLL